MSCIYEEIFLPGPECHTLLKAILRTVLFDRDVNARDLLGIVMDFMADV